MESYDDLVLKNMGLVYYVAKGYKVAEAHRQDLIAEGRLGLMEAAEKYDPSVGKFSTFAVYKIRYRVERFAKRVFGGVHVPRNAQLVMNKVAKHPGWSDEELATEYGYTLRAIRNARRFAVTATEDLSEAIATVGKNPYELAAGHDDRDEVRQILDTFFATLTRQEQLLLILRHGLNGCGPMEYLPLSIRVGMHYKAAERTIKTLERRLYDECIRAGHNNLRLLRRNGCREKHGGEDYATETD